MAAGKLFQGVDRQSAAYKLMQQMGWEEGSGLGRHHQGITTHVRVKVKADTEGVGIHESRKAASDWSVNTAVFDTILKRLSVAATCNSRGTGSCGADGDEDSSSGSDSDSEGPSKTTRQCGEDTNRKQGAVPTGSGEPAVRVVRHQGRYKRMERGKCVKAYSQGDLSAILGAVPGGAAQQTGAAAALPTSHSASSLLEGPQEKQKQKQPRNGKTKAGRKRADADREAGGAAGGAVDKGSAAMGGSQMKSLGKEGVDADAGASPSEQSRGPAAQAGWPAAAAGGQPGGGAAEGSAAAAEPSTAAGEEWWGAAFGFVLGGMLGDSAPAPQRKAQGEEGEGTGFREADQEDLYKRVQDKATSGRGGLGIADRPKKVAGARWSGKKVTFGDEAEEAQENAGATKAEPAQGGDSPQRADGGKGVQAARTAGGSSAAQTSRKRKCSEMSATEESSRLTSAPVAPTKAHLKRAVVKILKEGGGGPLLLAELHRRIAELPAGGSSPAFQRISVAKLRRKVMLLSSLQLQGDAVSLA